MGKDKKNKKRKVMTPHYVNRYFAGSSAWNALLKEHVRGDRQLIVDHANELIDCEPTWQRALSEGRIALVIASVRSTLTMGGAW